MSNQIPIALQVFSVRHLCEKDFFGTLDAIAEMGYVGVEFAGYYGTDAKTLRSKVDDLGLKVAGTHIMLNTLEGDKLGETIEFNQILGNKFLIVPWLPEQLHDTKAHWLETADKFNEIAENLKPHGMQVGYHNHMFEFQEMEGEPGWDIFFGRTRQDVVMQFDTGNALQAGADALPFLKRYPGRAQTVHLKEFSATDPDAVIGEGIVPWKELFEVCETTSGTEWYIVEWEALGIPALEGVKKCLDNLKAMGK